MKIKAMILTLILIMVSVASWAVINSPLEQPITTGGYVAVRLPAEYGCSSFAAKTYDGAPFYIARESDGSDGVLFPDDFQFSLTQTFLPSAPGTADGTVLFYAKGTTSTNIVGLFVW